MRRACISSTGWGTCSCGESTSRRQNAPREAGRSNSEASAQFVKQLQLSIVIRGDKGSRTKAGYNFNSKISRPIAAHKMAMVVRLIESHHSCCKANGAHGDTKSGFRQATRSFVSSDRFPCVFNPDAALKVEKRGMQDFLIASRRPRQYQIRFAHLSISFCPVSDSGQEIRRNGRDH